VLAGDAIDLLKVCQGASNLEQSMGRSRKLSQKEGEY
jgi:hypothetical protein